MPMSARPRAQSTASMRPEALLMAESPSGPSSALRAPSP